MKLQRLRGVIPMITAALFLTSLFVGLVASRNHGLSEIKLVEALLRSDMLETSTSDNAHNFNLLQLDPFLTAISIDTAVSGTRYENAWSLNSTPIEKNRLDILTFDSSSFHKELHSDDLCVFIKNAVYFPELETIVIDIQAAAALSKHVNSETVSSFDTVLAWIIGHEIGHAVKRHGRSAFLTYADSGCAKSMVNRLNRFFWPWCLSCKERRQLELEADEYFATKIVKLSNGREIAMDFLVPLLIEYFKSPLTRKIGEGSHPNHAARAVQLVDLLSCNDRDEEMDLLVGELRKLFGNRDLACQN